MSTTRKLQERLPIPPCVDQAFLQGHVALFFFAHRALAEAADAVLKSHGLGRAHHRAMFFTGRSPGISVMELLSILRVTNQGINRVMNDLLALDLIERRTDPSDGRIRRIYLTRKGHALTARCAAIQNSILEEAFRGRKPLEIQAMTEIVIALMPEQEKAAHGSLLPAVPFQDPLKTGARRASKADTPSR